MTFVYQSLFALSMTFTVAVTVLPLIDSSPIEVDRNQTVQIKN